jgi:hypothetical protein
MPRVQPPVDVDVVHAVLALVAARGVVRGRLMPAATVFTRFPLDGPVPIDLVVKLARARLEERRRSGRR